MSRFISVCRLEIVFAHACLTHCARTQVALGMLMKHKRAQRAAFERNDGALLPTLLAIRKAPGAGDAGALAAQLFSGLAQLEGGKERVAAALRADMKSTAAAEQDKAAKEDYTFV